MFRSLLLSQWAYSRTTLLFFVVLAFAASPVALAFFPVSNGDPGALVLAGEGAGALVLFAVGLVSLALGVQSWSIDAGQGHIYALSLPVSRGRYVTLRIAAVCTLLALVAAAVLLGGLAAVVLVELPATLHAYPFALALRALLCSWLVACTVIALRSMARDRLAQVVLAILVVAVVIVATVQVGLGGTSVGSVVWEALRSRPGPLSVLLGRWTLIDV
jgi:hypothetical protein